MDLRKLYNEETVLAIEEFVLDFEAIFPGLLSRDEILRRITTNMKNNIVFNASFSEEKVSGRFCDGTVYISKKVKSKEQVIFHEMIHVLTHGEFVTKFIYRHFIEGLTTLAEEMYVQYKGIKTNKRQRNVNGYIPTFVRELNFVKDGKLLEEFIKDPSTMYKLFLPKLFKYGLAFGREEKDFRREMTYIARVNENIVLMAKSKSSDQSIDPVIKELEENILEQYLSSVSSGLEEFDCNKFVSLYSMQLQPNILKYVDFLKELLTLGKISEEDIKNCDKLGGFYFLCDKDFSLDEIELSVYDFTRSEIDFIASMVFGYSLYVYNDEELVFNGVDLDKLFEEVAEYQKLVPLYRVIMEEVLNEGLSLDYLKDCYIRRCSMEKESFETQAYLRDIQKSREELLLEAIFGKDKDSVGTFALEDSEGINVIRDSAFFYLPVEASTFIEYVRQRNGLNSDILYSYLMKYDNFDTLFVDSTVSDDIDCFGTYSITMFAQKGTDLFKIIFSLKDNKVIEKIEEISFLDEKRSLFEKDTHEKLKSKDEDF